MSEILTSLYEKWRDKFKIVKPNTWIDTSGKREWDWIERRLREAVKVGYECGMIEAMRQFRDLPEARETLTLFIDVKDIDGTADDFLAKTHEEESPEVSVGFEINHSPADRPLGEVEEVTMSRCYLTVKVKKEPYKIPDDPSSPYNAYHLHDA